MNSMERCIPGKFVQNNIYYINMITLSIANDFNKTPGLRYKTQSPGSSGEEFREEYLDPKYQIAFENKQKLQVSLDGTAGYLTSFLEEAFGGLQAKYPNQNILDVIEVVSIEEEHWVEDIKHYVKKAIDTAR